MLQVQISRDDLKANNLKNAKKTKSKESGKIDQKLIFMLLNYK